MMQRNNKDMESLLPAPKKKLRFRGETNFQNRIDEFSGAHEELDTDNNHAINSQALINESNKKRKQGGEFPSFMDFFKVELTRGYLLEHDEERYTARRKKIYSFMRIPRDLERFMVYGIMQCADSFLYIHTFLPVRFTLAAWALLTRPIANCLGLRRRTQLLTPAEICDLLKCAIWLTVTLLMLSVDTNRVYHIIKSQSIIKLYIFYNMLEVGDRLLSAFGQDTIDALFWTATEPKNSKREHFGLITHIIFALIYVGLHSFLIMFQATTLNVAVNSNNKGLLTIMMSNNFVELKGSVFKKFDKNNLFQLTCSDVRERFHLSVLLFIVMIQTMKEFDWSFTQFCVMLPDCFAVLITEILIDWIKHAFITRFNELPEYIYREYTTSLAYDMTQTRQKHAFSDHSDLVARRMGFIPFPLGVVLIKAIYSAVSFKNCAAWILFALAFGFVLGLRICLTICALGKACKLMKEHQDEKCNSSTPSSTTAGTGTASVGPDKLNFFGVTTLPSSPSISRKRLDGATSPIHPAYNIPLQRSITIGPSETLNLTPSITSTPKEKKNATSFLVNSKEVTNCNSIGANSSNATTHITHNDLELDVKSSLELGATALFSNSDVDLDDVRLNEHVLEANPTNTGSFADEENIYRSEPDLQQNTSASVVNDNQRDEDTHNNPKGATRRSHKRSESEPSIANLVGVADANESHA
ncbi:protein TAPT1 homolog [Glossina fuscipes fuscipes]